MSSVVAEPPSTKPARGTRTLVRDILEVLLLAFALYLVIAFALQTVRVDGESMVPTLQSDDLLFANKLSYHFHAPERGDIVVLQPPDEPSTDFIKRVIGVPGDQIEIDGNYQDPQHPERAPSTTLLVKPDGKGPWQRIDEPFINGPMDRTFCCDQQGHTTPELPANPFTIPADQFWVLGDNRNRSHDSRQIGLIPRKNIFGKAWIRIWPASHFGFLGKGPTLVPTTALMLAIPPVGWRHRRRVQRELRGRNAA